MKNRIETAPSQGRLLLWPWLLLAASIVAGCSDRGQAPPVDAERPARLAVTETEASSSEMRAIRDELSLLDPAAEGFGSEILNSRADAVLSRMGELLAHPGEELGFQLTDDFSSSDLRPGNLEREFASGNLEVLRGPLRPATHLGRAGLVAALAELAVPFLPGAVKTKFKIDHIEEAGDGESVTSIIYLGMGRAPEGEIQQNARWKARWRETGEGEYALAALEASDYRENRTSAPLFADVTLSLFDAPEDRARIRRGIDSWWGRIDAGLGYSFYGDYALALGDIDNDGLDDVYFCQPGGVAESALPAPAGRHAGRRFRRLGHGLHERHPDGALRRPGQRRQSGPGGREPPLPHDLARGRRRRFSAGLRSAGRQRGIDVCGGLRRGWSARHLRGALQLFAQLPVGRRPVRLQRGSPQCAPAQRGRLRLPRRDPRDRHRSQQPPVQLRRRVGGLRQRRRPGSLRRQRLRPQQPVPERRRALRRRRRRRRASRTWPPAWGRPGPTTTTTA